MGSLFPRWPGLRLLIGSLLFNVASGCFTITLGQALFEWSGSVSAFTGIIVIEFMVPVVLGAVAGSIADRVNPAVVCAVASVVPALALLAYLVAPAGLLVVGVAIGLIVNLARPFYRAAIFAVGPRSLDPADLPRYNMRWTVSVQAGQIVGGAVAGAFLWAAGPKWAFLAAAAAYALAAFVLASARWTMSAIHDADRGTDREGWIPVLREATGSPRSVLSLLLLGVDFLTIAAFNVALAPLVHRLYGNESWLGILDACFAAGAVVAPFLWARCSSGVSSRQAVTSGYAIQIAGFATIALTLEMGGTVGQSGVPFGTVLLGLGVAVSSSQQVSILQTWAKSSTIGRVGALRQAVIGLTTAITLPVVGHMVDVDLAAAYGTVVAVLVLGVIVNVGVASRETITVAA
jgi:MFS family permease